MCAWWAVTRRKRKKYTTGMEGMSGDEGEDAMVGNTGLKAPSRRSIHASLP